VTAQAGNEGTVVTVSGTPRFGVPSPANAQVGRAVWRRFDRVLGVQAAALWVWWLLVRGWRRPV